jgi:small conductance mechanosensitive channel
VNIKATFWTDLGNWAVDAGWILLQIAGIIVGAFVLAWILRVIIRRVVRQIVNGVKKTQNVQDTQALVASPLAAVRVVQRTRTIGTVLSNVVNVTIGIIAVILIINTAAPTALGSLALLTAALGAGLGFGAQNIVKDVLNGLFMVMEDQLGVGDIVDLGSATGVVEAVGIRVTQVRDVNGTLWFVRNGEILRVGNMSQGWARIIIDLAVPYDTDVEAVQAKMLETANALATSPKWRSRIIEKPEVWGLESISEDALILRIVIKSRTTARDDVSRELRMRLKESLDEMGVKLPALNTIVLSGFDGAASVTGARPPRTKPVAVVEAPPKGRKARASRKAAAATASAAPAAAKPATPAKPATAAKPAPAAAPDPRSMPVVDPTVSLPRTPSRPPAKPEE